MTLTVSLSFPPVRGDPVAFTAAMNAIAFFSVQGLNIGELGRGPAGSVVPVGELPRDDAEQALLGIRVQGGDAGRETLDHSGVDRHRTPLTCTDGRQGGAISDVPEEGAAGSSAPVSFNGRPSAFLTCAFQWDALLPHKGRLAA
ncbi:hypothetical protein ACFVYD_06020 [Streptomyces sp. NPDC058301]|uniref:hypothetical protein n=1 Tax=Streptomyces sp. NPDC058301 TaxID=3346436 RepID=UPI0036EACD07